MPFVKLSVGSTDSAALETRECNRDLRAVHDEAVDGNAEGDPPGQEICAELIVRVKLGEEVCPDGAAGGFDVHDVGLPAIVRNPVHVAAEAEGFAGRAARRAERDLEGKLHRRLAAGQDNCLERVVLELIEVPDHCPDEIETVFVLALGQDCLGLAKGEVPAFAEGVAGREAKRLGMRNALGLGVVVDFAAAVDQETED